MTNPIVGVIAGYTKDHLLVEVVLHETLCGKYIRGRVVFEAAGDRGSSGYVLRVWEESTRQCSWCVRKLKKMQAEAE